MITLFSMLLSARIPPPRSMEETLPYIRVELESNSNEFKEVERLFRETMADDKIITSVERVDNLFLRDKYARYYVIFQVLCKAWFTLAT